MDPALKEEETKIKELFDSLQILAQEGEIPVQAFSMLIKSSNSKVICEQLHHKWLSDVQFVVYAPKIIMFLHNMDKRDVALASGCLALLINDYKNWNAIRNKCPLMYRNCVRAICEFYPIYTKIDSYVAESLLTPMFNSLNILLDFSPTEEDVECMIDLLIKFGHLFSNIDSSECDGLVMKMRKILCCDKVNLPSKSRYRVLQVIDFWTYSWDKRIIPDCLLEFHSEFDKQQEHNIKNSGFDVDDGDSLMDDNDTSKLTAIEVAKQDTEEGSNFENVIIKVLMRNDNKESAV